MVVRCVCAILPGVGWRRRCGFRAAPDRFLKLPGIKRCDAKTQRRKERQKPYQGNNLEFPARSNRFLNLRPMPIPVRQSVAPSRHCVNVFRLGVFPMCPLPPYLAASEMRTRRCDPDGGLSARERTACDPRGYPGREHGHASARDVMALDPLGRVTEIAEKRKAFTAMDAMDAKENKRLDWVQWPSQPGRTDRHCILPL